MPNYHTFGGQTFNLASSISSTQTTILLSSFIEPVSGVPYTMALINSDIAFGTIAPKTTSSEFISFTGITQNVDGTALLTGVTRGLAKKYPFTTSATFKLPHSGQSQFIISDVPQVFEEYPAKLNAETVSGDWTFTGNVTFSNFPVTPTNSDASTTVKGVTKLSVAPVSAVNPIAAGTNDIRIPTAYAVDSVGTDAYAITPSPAITAYATGQVFYFKAGTANTGPATLNVSGVGAIAIVKDVSTALVTGDILVNQIVEVLYNGTNMQMLSPVANLIKLSDIVYTSVTATKNAADASTTQNIAHGLGKIPKYVKITAQVYAGTIAVTAGLAMLESIATYNGTTQKSISTYDGNGTGIFLSDATFSLSAAGGTATVGTVTFDATNVIIAWVKTGTPTGTYQLLVETTG